MIIRLVYSVKGKVPERVKHGVEVGLLQTGVVILAVEKTQARCKVLLKSALCPADECINKSGKVGSLLLVARKGNNRKEKGKICQCKVGKVKQAGQAVCLRIVPIVREVGKVGRYPSKQCNPPAPSLPSN
jgi:hypothetical protein